MTLDTAAVERASDRVRAIRVEPPTLQIRAGEAIPMPRAWALDSAGRYVVDFVPLWSVPNDSVVGRRDRVATALRAGRSELRVQPARWHARSGGKDPVTRVVVLVVP